MQSATRWSRFVAAARGPCAASLTEVFENALPNGYYGICLPLSAYSHRLRIRNSTG